MAKSNEATDRATLYRWTVLTVIVLALLAICIYLLPKLLYPPLSGKQLEGVVSQKDRIELMQARLQLQNNARTTTIQGIGGVFFLVTAFFSWQQIQNSREQLEENRKQFGHSQEQARKDQLTTRFTQAIEQLANDKPHVQVGAIFALEQIALASDKDLRPIIEVLLTFVRDNALWIPDSVEMERGRQYDETAPDQFRWQAFPIFSPLEEEGALTMEIPSLQLRSPAVQAAMTVLGRLPLPNLSMPLDLGRVNLRKADLRGARLEGANLFKARLEVAFFHDANLRRANLFEAQLQGAYLHNADLRGANLQWGSLFGARLEGARLEGANLQSTNLNGAYLAGANLSNADIRDCDFGILKSATDVVLQGAVYDDDTDWPKNFKLNTLGAVEGPNARQEYFQRQAFPSPDDFQ